MSPESEGKRPPCQPSQADRDWRAWIDLPVPLATFGLMFGVVSLVAGIATVTTDGDVGLVILGSFFIAASMTSIGLAVIRRRR